MAPKIDEIASSPLKRPAPDDEHEEGRPLNLKGTQFLPTPASTDESPSHSLNGFKRELSPAGSISTLSSIQDVSSIGDAHTPRASTNSAPPAKRRKLTPAEKIEQQRLKEQKAQQKLADKAKKEEEQRVKDEEKRQKAEEREVKKREKELEDERKTQEKLSKKREKEAEEERKVQEKLKKERSQMRLGAFFQRPANADPIVQDSPDKNLTRRRSMSLETYDKMQVNTTSMTSTPVEPVVVVSDYHKFFLPFEPKPNTTLPVCSILSGAESETALARFDAELRSASAPEQYDLGLSSQYASISDHFRTAVPRGRAIECVRDCYTQLNGSQSRPVDLTTETNPLKRLKSMQMRYLEFHEDVRPAYYGTCTSIESSHAIKRLRRNPFTRERKDVDYDYDSEAEWEPPEANDEDLGADEDDEESLADDEELDGFLDDENDELKARRKIVADLQPQCSGLCWTDRDGRLHGERSNMMAGLSMQILLPKIKTPIDPFSTAYWETESIKPDTVSLRPPLQERSSNTASVKPDNGWPIASQPLGTKKASKPGTQKSMNDEEMEAFKTAIVGSALSKADMVLRLKSLFPHLTAAFVKDTLGEKFAQVGKSKSDKKWVYVVA